MAIDSKRVINQPSPLTLDIVNYLRSLSAHITNVSHARRDWILNLRKLIDQTDRGNPASIARLAAVLGREQIETFKSAKGEVGRLRPPADCGECHAAALTWLDHHVTACERLIRVGESRDMLRLHAASEPLIEAKVAAQRINTEYARLVSDLRRCVPRRSGRGGLAWLPFVSRPNGRAGRSLVGAKSN